MKAEFWRRRGRVPGTWGSNAAKWLAIEKGIQARRDGKYGYDDAGLDERVVEYPWIFDRLSALDQGEQRILDAGSILNHRPILNQWRAAAHSPVSIAALAFEGKAYVSSDVRYEFADLRELPYKDESFSIVLCISTLEHVGLDTTVYGSVSRPSADPAMEGIKAIRELFRVTRSGGTLLLSVPFGASSNRLWLRVFDSDDLQRVLENSAWNQVASRFFRVTESGWRECSRGDAQGSGYNEQGTQGGRTAPAYVAAAEAVALVELKRH